MKAVQLTPAGIEAEIERALITVVHTLDVSPSTREKYARIAQPLSLALAKFIQDGVPAGGWLVAYKEELLNKYTAATAAVYLAAAKAMLKGAEKAGLVTNITPVRGVKVSKGHKKQGVTKAEMTALNSVVESVCDVRTKALFTLLALQGLRQCEITRLDVTDVDLKDGVIRITGKGCDDFEIMPLHPQTARALTEYLATRGAFEGALFLANDNRSKANPRRLTVRGLNKILKAVFRIANVDRTVHGLRHLFITTLLEALDGNVVQTQRWSRHKSLEMLTVYNDERDHAKTKDRVFHALDALTL